MALHDDALRLAELDRQVAQTLVDGNIEGFRHALGEYLTLKTNLKQRMLDESTISIIDAEAREVLRKIGRNDSFRSDKAVERIENLNDDDRAAQELDDADIERLGSDLFYSWYSHYEYLSALGELRPLILGCQTSESVMRLAEQIKRCYSFQQYDAAFGLCRTMLEASIRDICVRRELFRDRNDNAVLFERLNWADLRNKVSSGRLNAELKDLYARLSKVLHARSTVAADEAREVFLETLSVIEELYEFHGL